MFQFKFRTSFLADLKFFKKDKAKQELIQHCCKEIIANPYLGSFLKSNMQGYLNFEFARKPELRILYKIYYCCDNHQKIQGLCRFEYANVCSYQCYGLIDFVFCKTREECNQLYKQSKKYFQQYERE